MKDATLSIEDNYGVLTAKAGFPLKCIHSGGLCGNNCVGFDQISKTTVMLRCTSYPIAINIIEE